MQSYMYASKRTKKKSQIACIESMHFNLNQEIHIYVKFHALKHAIFKNSYSIKNFMHT